MTTKKIIILSIETSCDETSLALLECSGGLSNPTFKLKKHIISSQIEVHRPFGGVVPNLAKREHLKNLPVLFAQLGDEKKLAEKIDYIAVTVGPGLEPALWTGINFAETLSKKIGKPLLGVSHLEGHLYSFLLSRKKTIPLKKLFPMIGLLVSGGHTLLVAMDNLRDISVLGETRDDAVGEAFDKVARLLQLPYPGGPEIEKIAKNGNPFAIPFPRPMIATKDFDFSFSGLKTAVLYHCRDRAKDFLSEQEIADIAASFQQAAIEVLAKKTENAVYKTHARSITLCGGVAANNALRSALSALATRSRIPFFVPDSTFNTDNAAMIGVAGYINLLQKKFHPMRADGNLLF
jgi:N6-L-threonylcarbamoyladenine synthase